MLLSYHCNPGNPPQVCVRLKRTRSIPMIITNARVSPAAAGSHSWRAVDMALSCRMIMIQTMLNTIVKQRQYAEGAQDCHRIQHEWALGEDPQIDCQHDSNQTSELAANPAPAPALASATRSGCTSDKERSPAPIPCRCP